MNVKFSDFTAIIQRLITAAIAIAVLMPVNAPAQESEDSGAVIEEIMVTASRRGEAGHHEYTTGHNGGDG